MEFSNIITQKALSNFFTEAIFNYFRVKLLTVALSFHDTPGSARSTHLSV